MCVCECCVHNILFLCFSGEPSDDTLVLPSYLRPQILYFPTTIKNSFFHLYHLFNSLSTLPLHGSLFNKYICSRHSFKTKQKNASKKTFLPFSYILTLHSFFTVKLIQAVLLICPPPFQKPPVLSLLQSCFCSSHQND